MKSIIQTVLAAVLLFAGANLALAQEQPKNAGGPPPDPTKMADQRTEDMAKTLDLNADQRAKVQEINRKYASSGRPGKRADGGTPPTDAERKAMHDQREAAHAQRDAELKTVLTPTQWEAWEKHKKDHKGDKAGKVKKTKKA